MGTTSDTNNMSSVIHRPRFKLSNISRRQFLFALAGVFTLPLTRRAEASVGLFEPFSFAYVSDVHLTTKAGDTYIMLQESQLFLQDVVKTLNSEKVDFVIFGGDQVETPGADDAHWQLFLDVAQGLSVPWSFVLGEADVSGKRFVEKMKTYGPDWKGKGINTTNPYWSQTPLPGVHLIGLDTSKPNVPTGELSNEQLDWLKKDLASNPGKFTIVFGHHPLLPPSPFDGGPPWDDYIVPQGANAREILGSSKYVRLVLSGHVHVSKIQQERDIWYVANPSLGVFPCCFRIFNVSSDQITVETYQVAYPALVKKARQILSSSQLAFKYNASKPDMFCEVAEGSRLDQNATLPLTPGASIQPLRANRKKKEAEQAAPEKPGKKKKGKEAPQAQPQPKKEEKKDEKPQAGSKPEETTSSSPPPKGKHKKEAEPKPVKTKTAKTKPPKPEPKGKQKGKQEAAPQPETQTQPSPEGEPGDLKPSPGPAQSGIPETNSDAATTKDQTSLPSPDDNK